MAMTEDMADFFNGDEFAVTAVWSAKNVNVIFDHEYTEQFGAAGNSPFITASAAYFVGIAKGQTIQLDSTNYTVKTFEPDGTGLLRIELLKA